MLRDADRTYTVLMDQLQDAFDDESRLKGLDDTDEQVSRDVELAQQRVQVLIQRISVMLDAGHA